MGKHYTQINLEERCRIYAMKEQGLSKAEIAKTHLASISEGEDKVLVAKAQSDPNNPEWTDHKLKKASRGRPRLPESKRAQPVTIKLDPRVIAHFKGDNPKGWQTRVNEALKKVAGL